MAQGVFAAVKSSSNVLVFTELIRGSAEVREQTDRKLVHKIPHGSGDDRSVGKNSKARKGEMWGRGRQRRSGQGGRVGW